MTKGFFAGSIARGFCDRLQHRAIARPALADSRRARLPGRSARPQACRRPRAPVRQPEIGGDQQFLQFAERRVSSRRLANIPVMPSPSRADERDSPDFNAPNQHVLRRFRLMPGSRPCVPWPARQNLAVGRSIASASRRQSRAGAVKAHRRIMFACGRTLRARPSFRRWRRRAGRATRSARGRPPRAAAPPVRGLPRAEAVAYARPACPGAGAEGKDMERIESGTRSPDASVFSNMASSFGREARDQIGAQRDVRPQRPRPCRSGRKRLSARDAAASSASESDRRPPGAKDGDAASAAARRR